MGHLLHVHILYVVYTNDGGTKLNIYYFTANFLLSPLAYTIDFTTKVFSFRVLKSMLLPSRRQCVDTFRYCMRTVQNTNEPNSSEMNFGQPVYTLHYYLTS